MVADVGRLILVEAKHYVEFVVIYVIQDWVQPLKTINKPL